MSAAPLFEGVEIATDDNDLSEGIDIIDSQTRAVIERDYLGFIETFNDNAIL